MSTPPLELPVLPAAPATAQVDETTYRRLAKRARMLSWLSLAWMTVEGAVAITAGAAASSIALIGFGLDSAIEGFASVIIVWRFTGHRMFSASAEWTRAEAGRHPVLPTRPVRRDRVAALAARRRAPRGDLGRHATKGEGRQNMLCAYLAGAPLLGLLGNVVAGAWWLDRSVGMLIAIVAVKEGP